MRKEAKLYKIPLPGSKNWKLLFVIWCIVFLYSCISALLVQLVILPKVFPAWHAGNGLLVGGDWLYFHALAADLAEKIHRYGWGVWQLRPEGQAPAGIAAAIYAVTIPKPYTMIPLNGILHATAAVVLYSILRLFVSNNLVAVWGIVPFVFYPSAMTWYTQIHKDGFFIAGVFLVIYGWAKLVRIEGWRSRPIFSALNILYIVAGAFLIWIVRPYGVQMMQGISIIASAIMTVIIVVHKLQGKFSWPVAAVAGCLLWLTVLVMTPFTKEGIYIHPSHPVKLGIKWEASKWLPPTIDNKFYSLAVIRERFLEAYPQAASNIDSKVHFHSANEIIEYLPRAAQIIIFSPFPNQWFGKGTLEANTLMRRVSAVETIGVYAALPFFCLAVWRWRRCEDLWCILTFVFGMMLIYGVTVPNIGSLYRVRYCFLMIIVGMGIVYFVQLLHERRRKKRINGDGASP